MTASKKLIQAAAGSAGGDFYPYTIDNSARFASGSDKLTRTNSGSGSTKGCFSMWVKRSNLNPSAQVELIGTGVGEFYFTNSTMGGGVYYPDAIGYYEYFNGGYQGAGTSSINSSSAYNVFRDVSAWYHVFIVWDTTLATATDRYQIWVNNQRVTLTVDSNVTQNTLARWFASGDIVIGNNSAGTKPCLSYLAEVVGVEGTAYAPTDFAQDKNGVWVPKNVSGLTFGTNGFYLKFANSGALGTDSSGNGNNFTVSGLTSSDQMLDTPTNNFATLNPLSKGSSITLSEGNLKATCSTGVINNTLSTLATPTSGTKVYWELTINAVSSSFRMEHGGKSGYEPGTNYLSSANPGFSATFHETAPTNTFYFNVNGSNQTTLSSITPLVANDVVQYAYDPDTGKIWVGRNGTWLNSGNPSAGTGNVGTLTTGLAYNVGSMLNGNLGAQTVTYNFGQSGFAYTPPTGFSALSTANLPEPTIGPNSDIKPSDVFGVELYTGNGTAIGSGGKTVDCGVDMTSGDYMVAIKNRDAADSWMVFDTVRGATKYIRFDLTSAEATDTESLTAFTATGVTLGNNAAVNTNTEDYVLYWFKVTAGFFDIQLRAGTGSTGTNGHDLGVVPKLIITRNRTTGPMIWPTYCASLNKPTPETWYLDFSGSGPAANYSYWNSTAPTSGVYSLSTDTAINASSNNYVDYLFADVEGFCKTGYYKGNGGSDGPFQYLGFSPELHIIKQTNAVGGWFTLDTEREPYNPTKTWLYLDTNGSENSANIADLNSNGSKLRFAGGGVNVSSNDYITLSIGTSSKYSNAR